MTNTRQPIIEFVGPADDKGIRPRYALYASKDGAFEIYRWRVKKKHPSGGVFEFYKALVNLEHAAERMLTLATGPIFAKDIATLTQAWEKASATLLRGLQAKLEQTGK